MKDVIRVSAKISRQRFLVLNRFFNTCENNLDMDPATEVEAKNPIQEIIEGLAKVRTAGNVFYNPVQEFNRDLSISVITTFAKQFQKEKAAKNQAEDVELKGAGVKDENGISILEALSATGLRSIRYAKEIPGVRTIIANDISSKAVADIKDNITLNDVGHIIEASQNDATSLMYQHKKEGQFDVIDLDPYGCPSIFLDSTVQAIKNRGLLLVTATDMAVLAGNTPETCYTKYGAISLRMKSCHEMAVRILLQCIESHANRYNRYIEPVLSLSADFYIRVFVRVYTGAQKCKHTTSKLSHVYHCTGCDGFVLQPLGIKKAHERNAKLVKFCLPTGPLVANKCKHCGSPYHIGGPIWTAPIHSPEFVRDVLNTAPPNLGTYKRIQGVLSVILEELVDVPLYYAVERLASTIRVGTPPMMSIRSAILNAGYKVSYTHMYKTAIKTDAPSDVLWDIMRCWEKMHPASKKSIADNRVASTILQQSPEQEYSFEMHSDAMPASKQHGLIRFQENPLPFWGPGSRARAMVSEDRMSKSRQNQGKRKRQAEDSDNNQ